MTPPKNTAKRKARTFKVWLALDADHEYPLFWTSAAQKQTTESYLEDAGFPFAEYKIVPATLTITSTKSKKRKI